MSGLAFCHVCKKEFNFMDVYILRTGGSVPVDFQQHSKCW